MHRSSWVIGSRCLAIVFETACSNMRDVVVCVEMVAGKSLAWLL
jgi:hypothetical protein